MDPDSLAGARSVLFVFVEKRPGRHGRCCATPGTPVRLNQNDVIDQAGGPAPAASRGHLRLNPAAGDGPRSQRTIQADVMDSLLRCVLLLIALLLCVGLWIASLRQPFRFRSTNRHRFPMFLSSPPSPFSESRRSSDHIRLPVR